MPDLKSLTSRLTRLHPAWMEGAVLLLFIATLATAYLIPVYPDDIMYMVMESRAGYDGWASIHSVPQCYSNFATPIGWTLLPGRWLAWKLHDLTPDFAFMRLFALGVFVAWLGYMGWLIRRIFIPSLSWRSSLALIVALASLGVVPFQMMQSRHEGVMLLALTWYASLPFIARRYAPFSRRQKTGLAAAILLVSSWFFLIHPEALLYAILIAAVCCYLPFEQRWTRALLVCAVLGIAAQAWAHLQQQGPCPDWPPEQAFRDKQVLNIGLLSTQPTAFIAQFASDVWNSDTYIKKILFNPPQQYWLFHAQTHGWMEGVNLLVALTALALVGVLALGMAWRIEDAITRRDWKNPRAILLACFLAALLIKSGFRISKNFYESGFVWLMLVLSAGMVLDRLYRSPVVRALTPYLWRGLLGVSILSQLVLIGTYAPPAKADFYPPLPNTLSLFYSGEVNERVQQTAKLCNIAADNASRHVVVDLNTYVGMKKTYQPFMYPIIAARPGRAQLFTYLAETQSSGMVTSCNALPPDIRDIARKNEEFCCVSRHDIESRQSIPAPAH